MSDFKTTQDVLPQYAGGAYAGFNRRVYGSSYADAFKYPNERQDREMVSGWYLADRMIDEGRLFYIRNFHVPPFASKGCFGFQYGGTWVCNGCGASNLDREWWKIKVFKDGNAWCCIGTGFEDLMASENYEFGDTREEAIEKYGLKVSSTRRTGA